MLSDFFLDPLLGRIRLWRVVWLYGFVLTAGFIAIIDAIQGDSNLRPGYCFAAGIVLTLYQLTALWQCARNNPSPFLARFVRLTVIMGVFLLPLFIYLVITDSVAVSP
jgi:hypothetical protein